MQENVDKQLENLVGKAMKKSALETPSFDFTSAIMGKVEAMKASAHTTYQPLISKRAWLVIVGVFLIFVVYVIGLDQPNELGWFDAINFSFLSTNSFSEIFKGIQLSSTTRISILMFAVLLLIQIPLLKYYFDKRILT